MNRQIRRFIISLALIIILLIVLTAFIINYYTYQGFIDVMFFMRPFPLPLVAILIMFAFCLTLVVFIIIKIYYVHKMRQIEKVLNHLIEGHYSSKLLKKMTSAKRPVVSKKADDLFLNLQSKLISISKEIIMAKEEQSKLSTETREEIIEAERKRIARELHDSVSQQLFASSMILSAINEQENLLKNNPAIASQLKNIERILNESQSEMRALLLHLRPVKLNTKSLKEGVEQLLKELSTKIQMTIKYDIENVDLPMSTEDNLFRIVQELLSNVLRHSKANELEVYLKKVDQRVQLRVIDDGVGFNLDKENSGSYGLPNIKERIAGLGGNVKIISFPSQGTSVDISIPVDLEEDSD